MILRRRRPRIPDRAYAWTYLLLLIVVTIAMIIAAIRAG
jgi:hypothetical protein